jgi:hypothetical protein
MYLFTLRYPGAVLDEPGDGIQALLFLIVNKIQEAAVALSLLEADRREPSGDPLVGVGLQDRPRLMEILEAGQQQDPAFDYDLPWS